MANYQQKTTGMNYFCCGNPWDDIFGSSNQTSAESQKPQQVQDWNNPFSQPYQPNDEARHFDNANRTDGGDTRSVGSGGYAYRKSNLDGKSLKDIEREDHARIRAMRLQESMIENGAIGRAEGASVLSSEALAYKHERKRTFDDPEVAAKTAAVNRAVQEIKILKGHQQSVAKTETTRPKKELTPEDVRDPETIPGMKCKVDIDKEEEAKKKAFEMITTGNYQYDSKGGIAVWSKDDTKVVRRDKCKVQEIV